MKRDHKLTYIDMHPQRIQPAKRWPAYLAALATVAVFAAIGAMLAY